MHGGLVCTGQRLLFLKQGLASISSDLRQSPLPAELSLSCCGTFLSVLSGAHRAIACNSIPPINTPNISPSKTPFTRVKGLHMSPYAITAKLTVRAALEDER